MQGLWWFIWVSAYKTLVYSIHVSQSILYVYSDEFIVFVYTFCRKLSAECASERIMKIGEHLAKI